MIKGSLILLFKKYGIKSGVLVIDETDKKRSKTTTAIFNTYKVFDKKTGGYFNGQTLVILFLVTSKISIPVGFKFYKPDPAIQEWKKKDAQLKLDKIAKKDRPEAPARNPNYPTKEDLAIALLSEFGIDYPDFKVDAILGDALYGTKIFFNSVNKVFPNTQVISQVRSNQNIVLKNGNILSMGAATL